MQLIENLTIQAIENFQKGNFDASASLLKQILKLQQKNITALILLGLVNVSQKKYTEAKNSFKKALSVDPDNYSAIFNYAQTLYELKEYINALKYFEKILKVDPKNLNYQLGYAATLSHLDRYAESTEIYKRLLAQEPKSEKILTNLIQDLINQHKYDETIEYCNQLLLIDKGSELAILNKAIALNEKKQFDEADNEINKIITNTTEERYLVVAGIIKENLNKINEALILFKKAFEINKNSLEIRRHLATCYAELGDYEAALNLNDSILAIDGNNEFAINGIAYTLSKMRDYENSINWYRRSLQINQKNIHTLSNLAIILAGYNQPTEALELYNRALNIEPGFSEAINNRGHLFLSQMNFLQGWPDYEARFHTKAYDSKPIESKKPIWNGDFSLQGPLFIWGEQGVGDQILHSSMLTNLMTLPQKKIVGIQDKLIPLFKRSFPDFEFIDLSQETVPEERYEAHIPIGSLGQFFKRTTADFSEQKPYLVDDSLLTAQFRKQLKHSGKILCGLSWKSVNQRVGDDKSIPLTALLPILNNPKLEFINLQYGDVTTEMEAFQKEHQIHIQSLANLDIYNDLDGLASLIQACDLVITGSNSTAHLAGAMGKETFLLLPKHAGKFWYWHTLDKKSLWYPSINIYQQKEQGEWSDPVLEIKKELESRSE
jgi:tetratricopeptide (TPR) repeat protein/ADP-heptose:LPS heptosyltransferase